MCTVCFDRLDPIAVFDSSRCPQYGRNSGMNRFSSEEIGRAMPITSSAVIPVSVLGLACMRMGSGDSRISEKNLILRMTGVELRGVRSNLICTNIR